MKKYLVPILFVLSLSIAFIPFGSTAQVSSSYARRFAPSTFAALGTPPNGSVRYCSNCAATSPCTSGGSGATASRVNGAWNCSSGGSGTGDTAGAASSTDNAIARFDGTGGKTLQNSVVTVSDTGSVAGVADLTIARGSVTSGSGLAITSTWTGGGTFPGSIFLNITDTSSGVNSLLMDLQVGGLSKFKVDKGGGATFDNTINAQSSITTAGDSFFANGADKGIKVGGNAWITGPGSDVVKLSNAAFNGPGLLISGRMVAAKTSSYTVLATESNTFFTNTGAGAGVTFTLPTPTVGMTYEFYRDANQTVTIDVAGGVTIRVGTSVTTSGGDVTLDAVGSKLKIVAISTTQWVGELVGSATFN